MSRKLTYVAGLVACFSCASKEGLASPKRTTADLIAHLEGIMCRPPLETLAEALSPYLVLEPIAQAARELFVAYDKFVELIDNDGNRKHLEELAPEGSGKDPLYQDARMIGHAFQEALTTIFIDKNDTDLYRLTRIYGVF